MGRNSSHISGEVSEFEVARDLVANGYRISLPYGEYRYDLVADYQGSLLRIQIKTARKRKGQSATYEIPTRDYDAEEVDLVAGYIEHEGKDIVYYTPVDEAGTFASVNVSPKSDLSDHNASEANLLEEHTFEAAAGRVLRTEMPY